MRFRKHDKLKLTELKARDVSCPKGKKVEHKINLINRDLSEDYKDEKEALYYYTDDSVAMVFP